MHTKFRSSWFSSVNVDDFMGLPPVSEKKPHTKLHLSIKLASKQYLSKLQYKLQDPLQA